MSERSAKDVVEEMFRRQQAGDDTALDDLVAADMVNHAAGPQGREGLKLILRTIDNDLGPVTVEQHHLIGEGDLVAQHLTLHGTHRASTMPLLADTPVSGRAGGVDVHPHLAGRRRDDRRALGVPRRHGPARAAARLTGRPGDVSARPVRGGHAVRVTGGPLDQLDPVAVGIVMNVVRKSAEPSGEVGASASTPRVASSVRVASIEATRMTKWLRRVSPGAVPSGLWTSSMATNSSPGSFSMVRWPMPVSGTSPTIS